MIHLDTNAAIAVLNDRPTTVRVRLMQAQKTGTSVALSMIVYHELMVGAACSIRRRENEESIALLLTSAGLILLPFDDADAREAADIRAYLRRQATPIGNYDALIAAQARRAGAALVTANRREFDRIPGLIVTDWAA